MNEHNLSYNDKLEQFDQKYFIRNYKTKITILIAFKMNKQADSTIDITKCSFEYKHKHGYR